MSDLKINKVFAVGSAGVMELKRYASMVLNMPKSLLKVVFKIQMAILYVPIRFLNSLYSLVAQQSRALENRDGSVQATSDLGQELSCNKSVQVNTDSKNDSSCNKPVQINSYSENGSYCNGYLQATLDSKQGLSCDKSVQATPESQQQELFCDKSVQVVPDLQQELSPVEVESEDSSSSDTEEAEDSCNAEEEEPILETGADFIRYSKVVLARTRKLIDELPNAVLNYKPSDKTANKAANTVKTLQCKNNFKETVPAVKQALLDINCKEKTIEGIKEILDSSKHVQANPELEHERYTKSVRADSDNQHVSSCFKSLHTAKASEVFSMPATLNPKQGLSGDKSVKVVSDLLQESSPVKVVESEDSSSDTEEAEDLCNAEEEPILETGADFIRYSKVVLARTRKLIDELPDAVLNYKPSAKTANKAAKTIKTLQCKNTFKGTVPAVKQALLDISCKENTIEGIKEILDSTKLTTKSHKPLQSAPNRETTNEESHNGQFVLSLSMDVLQNMVDIITQEIALFKRRLAATNNKIEEVLKSSCNLCEEISKINERFNRLVILSSKITDLQNQLCNGNRVLKEVEADRNEMQHKLNALTRLIKEEEEYLGDVSYESGYDETELRAKSSNKHDDD